MKCSSCSSIPALPMHCGRSTSFEMDIPSEWVPLPKPERARMPPWLQLFPSVIRARAPLSDFRLLNSYILRRASPHCVWAPLSLIQNGPLVCLIFLCNWCHPYMSQIYALQPLKHKLCSPGCFWFRVLFVAIAPSPNSSSAQPNFN